MRQRSAGLGSLPWPRCCASPRCGRRVPNFRYRALTSGGEIVSGSLSAATPADVVSRIEYLGLIPIEAISDGTVARSRFSLKLGGSLRSEHVTVFTRDLSLLLKAGARLD